MGQARIGPDGLSATYWTEIGQRVTKSIDKLAQRQQATAAGRIIPDDEDLVIGEGKGLRLAVMYLDICDFSGWPSGDFSEQASVLTVFNLYMTEMVRIASDYGGDIEKNTGDGLLIYFDPQTGETDEDVCKRALACGLSMLATTHYLVNPVLQASKLPEVHFRIGMDFGPVTIARIGSSKLFNSRVAIGSVANVASKMLAKAGEDEVVVGNEFRNRLPTTWAQHSSLLTMESGFVYVVSQSPYPLYKYTGRWTRLV
ncbi:MAG: adenylate/guanylate cyclase domain-containing protein [Candidatus Sulfotelmatobacter sp.]